MLVDLRDVSFGYRRKAVLSGVSLALEAGESVAVMGPSGSGKSTLASIVATLVRPQAGTAVICGEDVTHLSRRALAKLRRGSLGMVFQGAELVPTMTAVENVALPAMLEGSSWDEASSRAVALLADLGVEQIDTPAATLSGGEAQRVGLARALVNGPSSSSRTSRRRRSTGTPRRSSRNCCSTRSACVEPVCSWCRTTRKSRIALTACCCSTTGC